MKCEGCGKEFDLESGRGMYRRVMCYTCQPINGDRKQTYRNKHLKKKYGFTQAEYVERFHKQNGECEVCKVKMVLQNGTLTKGSSRNRSSCTIDHCHVSNKVRGLVCFSCNIAIGHVNDDPNILSNMIDYLQRYK